jgi:hypothetical protein
VPGVASVDALGLFALATGALEQSRCRRLLPVTGSDNSQSEADFFVVLSDDVAESLAHPVSKVNDAPVRSSTASARVVKFFMSKPDPY